MLWGHRTLRVPTRGQMKEESVAPVRKGTRKALLLAFHYPPRNGPGAVRPAMMAKWLPKFGWDTVVVCGRWTRENTGELFDSAMLPESQARVVATVDPATRKKVRRVVQGLKAGVAELARLKGDRWRALPASLARAPVLLLKDLRVRIPAVIRAEMAPYEFTKRLIAALPEVIERERPDVIWATSKAAGVHAAADAMGRRFAIPWVADFRDIPDQVSLWKHAGRIRRYWARYRQYSTAKRAAAVVTVSPALAATLSRRLDRPVHTIPNGFDPEEHARAKVTRQGPNKRFTLTYAGSIYPAHRDPRPLFAALDRLAARGEIDLSEVSVNFWGPGPATLTQLLPGFECRVCVNAPGFIPRKQALAVQQVSDALLLLSHGGERGIYTSKVFEYLGARRPILCIPGDGDCVDALLKETGAGVSCSTADEICALLLRWYREWKATGSVRYQGRDEAAMRYTREAQAKALAELFDSLVAQDRLGTS